ELADAAGHERSAGSVFSESVAVLPTRLHDAGVAGRAPDAFSRRSARPRVLVVQAVGVLGELLDDHCGLEALVAVEGDVASRRSQPAHVRYRPTLRLEQPCVGVAAAA